jgi:hypothetical protein
VQQPPLAVGDLDASPQNARWVPPTDAALEKLYEGAQADAVQQQAQSVQAQGGGAVT